MKKEKVTWTTGGVFICSKCGAAIEQPAEELRDYLREELKTAGVGKEIRVMTSGCLKVCPDKAQAVVYVPNADSISTSSSIKSVEAFVLDPKSEREILLKELLTKV